MKLFKTTIRSIRLLRLRELYHSRHRGVIRLAITARGTAKINAMTPISKPTLLFIILRVRIDRIADHCTENWSLPKVEIHFQTLHPHATLDRPSIPTQIGLPSRLPALPLRGSAHMTERHTRRRVANLD